MVINVRNYSIIWEWPTDKMAWFFWGWSPTVWNGQDTGWRIGPLTLWKRGDKYATC